MLGHKAYMKVEIELTPVSAMHETLELAQIVDQFGAERLGISDVVFLGTSIPLWLYALNVLIGS